MEIRTEILTESVGATHFDGQTVLWPIGNPPQHHVEEVAHAVEQRKAREAAAEQFIEESRAMRRDLEQKRRARDRLVEAGYDPAEVPI